MRCPYIRYKIPSREILEFILLPIFTRDVSFYYVLCLVGIQVFEIQMCCKEIILKDFFLRWYCQLVSKQSLHHMLLFTIYCWTFRTPDYDRSKRKHQKSLHINTWAKTEGKYSFLKPHPKTLKQIKTYTTL